MTASLGRWFAVALTLVAAAPTYAGMSLAPPATEENAKPIRRLTLLGDAAATAGDTTKGAAGIGIELLRDRLWVSAVIRSGAAATLETENPREFWSLLLVPSGGGASVSLDLGYYAIDAKNAEGTRVLWLGPRIWATASKVVWKAGSATSNDINLFAFQGGLAARYDITADLKLDRKNYDVALTWGLALSGRIFTGDGAFVFAHAAEAAPNYRGLQADFAIELNKFRAFVQMPMMRRSPTVPGITGTHLLIGLGVRGDLVTLSAG